MRLLPRTSDLRLLLIANLFVTRQLLTGIILFVAVFCFLLPASVITYFSFRKLLIPLERIQVPVNFLSPTDTHFKTRDIDVAAVFPYLQRNKNLTFGVNLNLHGVCKIETSHQIFSYDLELPSSSHSLARHYQDLVLVNCDSRYIYAAKNRLVPYNLRYWAPPIAVDVTKLVDMDHQVLALKGYELLELLSQEMLHITLIDMNFLFLHPQKSSVDFVVLWDGFRFYLVRYYFTSLIIGTAIFWIPSSCCCVFFAFLVLMYLKPGHEIAKPAMIKQEE